MRPEMEQTEARDGKAALESNLSTGRISSVEAALLWSWMAVITIGVRFFWNSK